MIKKNIKKEIPFLKNNKKIIFFDNSSTTLKPKSVIKEVNYYYKKLGANANRGDYDLSFRVDNKIEKTRESTANFINSKKEEIVFTSGTTMGVNAISYGILKDLKKDDEIILSKLEHSSNLLPWFRIAKEKNLKIKFTPVVDGKIKQENIINLINEKTKVVSLSLTSNVLGQTIDGEIISKKIREKNKNIFIHYDAAQYAPYNKIDINKFNCDFLTFSGHKLGSPNGVGVLFIKNKHIENISPLLLGGGDNKEIKDDLNYKLYKGYRRFEAGTPNIEGIMGLGKAIEHIEKVGIENINKKTKEIRNYALLKMEKDPNIEIYNKNIDATTIVFNIKNVFAQDAASLLNKYNICLRAGQHCARLLEDIIQTPVTLRASFYYYNTKKEVDKFIKILKKGDDYLEAFF